MTPALALAYRADAALPQALLSELRAARTHEPLPEDREDLSAGQAWLDLIDAGGDAQAAGIRLRSRARRRARMRSAGIGGASEPQHIQVLVHDPDTDELVEPAAADISSIDPLALLLVAEAIPAGGADAASDDGAWAQPSLQLDAVRGGKRYVCIPRGVRRPARLQHGTTQLSLFDGQRVPGQGVGHGRRA